MGFFKKTKHEIFGQYAILDKEYFKKHKYMNTSKMRYSTQIVATKQLIKNKYDGKSNKDNINSLITWLNTYHEPHFTNKKLDYESYLKTQTQTLDEDKIKSLIPNLKELVSYNSFYSILRVEYQVKLLYDNYNYDDKSISLDDYEFTIDSSMRDLLVINDNLADKVNSEYEVISINEETGEEIVEVKQRVVSVNTPSVNTRFLRGTAPANIELTLAYYDFKNNANELKIVEISSDENGLWEYELKEEYTTEMGDDIVDEHILANAEIKIEYIETIIDEESGEEKEIIHTHTTMPENRYRVGDVVPFEKYGFSTENSIQEYIGKQVDDVLKEKIISEFNLDEKDDTLGLEEIDREYRVLNAEEDPEEYVYDEYNAQIEVISYWVWEGHTFTQEVGGQTYEDYKDENVSTIIWVPKKFITFYDISEAYDDYFVEYIDTDNKRQIYRLENVEQYIVESRVNNLRLASAIPVKGVIPKKGTKEYKYWKLSLERTGRKNKDYRRKPKNIETTIYDELAKEGDVEHAWIHHRFNIAAFLKKSIRKDRFWQKYLGRCMKFFDEKVVTFAPSLKEAIGQTLYIDTYTDDNAMASEKKSAYRIRGFKKQWSGIETGSTCYLGVEPDEPNCLVLYINVADLDNNSVTQYGLDLTYWFGGYHFSSNYADNWHLDTISSVVNSALKIVWGSGGYVGLSSKNMLNPIFRDNDTWKKFSEPYIYGENKNNAFTKFAHLDFDNLASNALDSCFYKPIDLSLCLVETKIPYEGFLGRTEYMTEHRPIQTSVEFLKAVTRQDVNISDEKYQFYAKYAAGIGDDGNLLKPYRPPEQTKYYKSQRVYSSDGDDWWYESVPTNDPKYSNNINKKYAPYIAYLQEQKEYIPSLNGDFSIPKGKNNDNYTCEVREDYSWLGINQDNLKEIPKTSYWDNSSEKSHKVSIAGGLTYNGLEGKIINRANSTLKKSGITYKSVDGSNISQQIIDEFLADLSSYDGEELTKKDRYKEITITHTKYYASKMKEHQGYINLGQGNIKDFLDVNIPDDWEDDTYYVIYRPPYSYTDTVITQEWDGDVWENVPKEVTHNVPSQIRVIRIKHKYKLMPNQIEEADDSWDEIPNIYAKATKSRGKIDFTWMYEPDFTPRYISKLWFRIPMVCKECVVNSTIFISYRIHITYKVLRGWVKIAIIVISFVVAYFTGGAILPAVIAAMSSYVSLYTDNQLLGQILGVVAAVMTAGAGAMAQGASSSGVVSSIAQTVVTQGIQIAFSMYQTQRTERKMEKAREQAELEQKNREEAAKQEFEDMLQEGVKLEDFNVNTDFGEEMDMFYFVAYGGLLYDFNTHRQLNYEKEFQIYDESNYNRYK